jgi:hypothetical protein
MGTTNNRLIFGILGLVGLLITLAVAVLILPYPYSQLFNKDSNLTPESSTIDSRYMAEINGIETPKDMERQYNRHPEAFKFAIDDEWVVMFAYPDPEIRWTGMVFIHNFPSLSEFVLDFDGNAIFEQVTSPEVRVHVDGLLNNTTFVEQLQNQMSEIWDLNDPGEMVLELVEWLKTTDVDVEYLGGRPQTLFDAPMYLIRVNGQDLIVYEFEDEEARRKVSENISPDGYEVTEVTGEMTKVIHIEYLDQPNFWIKGKLLVQYLGKDKMIIDSLSSVLGIPITNHIFGEIDNFSGPDSTWQTYSNPFFGISLEYPSHWKHVDGDAPSGERYAGEDGYFTFSAMRGGGLTLDLAAEREAQHKLMPYGPEPIIEEISVQTQEARLITPSDSQDDNNKWGAALLVMYPQPVTIMTGGEEHHYPIFVLYSDPVHIRGIVESLEFDETLLEKSEATEVFKENVACQSISEIKAEMCWPPTFSIIQITEHNRRGSFKAYGFQVNGLSQTPYLSEIQFFSEESIATFTSNCGGDAPCFFGDYPNLERYTGLNAAYETGVSYKDYALKRFRDRDFLVMNLPCYGDDCVIREYTTFFGDVMVAVWIVLKDESQDRLSDQLFYQVVFVQS